VFRIAYQTWYLACATARPTLAHAHVAVQQYTARSLGFTNGLVTFLCNSN